MHPPVQVGLVDVEVHHAGVGSSDLGDVGVAESSSDLSRAAPFRDFLSDAGISAFDHAGDHRVALAEPLQVGHHLAYRSAGIAFAQPGSDVGVVIVQRFQLLDVDQNHGNVQILHRGEHVVGSGIGQQLQKDQVHVRGPEQVSGRLGLLFGRNHSAVDDLYGIRKRFLKRLVLSLELRNQRRELRQVRA